MKPLHGGSGDSAAPVAIVTALPVELAPLRRRSRVERSGSGGLTVWCGTLASQPVLLACTGDGPCSAEAGVEELLAAHAVRALIGVGVGGALSPELQHGDLLVAKEVRDGKLRSRAVDPSWRARAIAAGARPAVLVSVDRVMTRRSDKEALWCALAGSGAALDFGGRTLPAAADTESWAWACAAARRGVPCLLVRSICDVADDELPAPLGECVTPGGGVDRRRIAVRLLRQPQAWPVMLRLGLRVRTAAERAAELVESILRAVPERPAQAAEMLLADPRSAASSQT